MSERELELEWYVLNEERNLSFTREDFKGFPYTPGPIVPWNIFNNFHVYEETIKLCKRYKKDKMTFDSFVEELRKIISWQEWARCEYEIMVGSLFPSKEVEGQKIDCYQQVLPNIRVLAEYVLRKYYPRIKI